MIEVIQVLMHSTKDIINAFAEHPEAAGMLLLAYLGGKHR